MALLGVIALAAQITTTGGGPGHPTLAVVASYGPLASITCPVGAVSVSGGSAALQTAINANAASTAFCLTAGTHTWTSSVTPKTGDTFVGAFGAILDGTGWVSSDSTQAAFRAHNEDIDNVTIRNLVIRTMPQKCIHAFRDFSSGWTVEYNEITGCHDGVSLSSGATVQYNYIHHNIGDPTNVDAGLRGGGYVFNEGTGLLVYHNEISYNGPEQKSIDIGVITWRDNFVHHNYESGIWVDGDGNGSLIEDNRVEDQTIGIWYESARGGTIRNNTVSRHTQQGIFLSTSQTTTISGNTLSNNVYGLHAFVNLDIVGLFAWVDDLANNTITNNTVTTSGSGHYAALFSTTGSGTSDVPYVTNTKNNNFTANHYDVDSLTDSAWLWVTPKTFTQWQALPQDTAGTVQ